MAQRLGGETPSVSMVVTQTSTEKAGYETYHVVRSLSLSLSLARARSLA
jgi:hypothetical protein